MCVSRIGMCDMSHSYVCHDSFICMCLGASLMQVRVSHMSMRMQRVNYILLYSQLYITIWFIIFYNIVNYVLLYLYAGASSMQVCERDA